MGELMEIVPFTSKRFGILRTAEMNGEPVFVAADVCKPLDIANTTDALKRLDDDEKARLNLGLPGGDTNVVTLPGLLNLVLSSRKSEAKAYRRWVTHEVLPAIHRDGGYMVAKDETPEQTMARALLMADATIRRQEKQLESMRPRAALADAVTANGADTYTVTQAARYVAQMVPTFTRQRAFDLLRAARMMCKGSCEPTREGIDVGRVVAVRLEFVARDGRRLSRQTARLTGKGLAWLVSRAVEGAM